MFGVGHASTADQRRARLRRARATRAATTTHVIAVVGDGALTGGLAYEGLNNAGQLRHRT